MNRVLKNVFGAMWRSTSGLLAVLLIGAALVFGVWVGRAPIREARHAAEEKVAQEQETQGKVQEYTCSMHPQVRLRDPRAKCPICFMDLIPVVEGPEGGGERRLVLSEAAAKLAEIVTAPAARLFPSASVRMVGRVDFDETRRSVIAAWFPARVDRLYVNYTGVGVEKGHPLADVFSPELIAAQEELRQASLAVKAVEQGSELVRGSTRATLAAAREKLRLWGLSGEQIEAIEVSGDVRDHLTIHAPIGGIVVSKPVVEGMYAQTGEAIYEIADLSLVWVRLEAFESQVSMLRFGQEVEFTTEAYPGETFRGRIAFIDPVVSPEMRTVKIRVNVRNADGRLKPGMFVRSIVRARLAGDGRIVADEMAGRWISPMHPEIIKDQPGTCDVCGMALVSAEELGYVTDVSGVEPPLVIPASAALITGRRAVVYVRVAGAESPTFEGREVVLGARAGDWYIVREGLVVGDEVVVHGAFKIDSAMQIAAKPSMMGSGGAGAAGHAHGESARRAAEAPPEMLLRSLKPVYGAYFSAQEALAEDDFGAFREAVADLTRGVEQVSVQGVFGETLGTWRRISKRLGDGLSRAGTALDVSEARVAFGAISSAVIELSERVGHVGGVAYVRAHCPMAFDNRGADWLQIGDEISNPYFGASMLRCGEVKARHEPLSGGGR